MKLFVAGPMRGHPEFNTPAFNQATETLVHMGHTVYNPAHYDSLNGHDWTGCDGTQQELDDAQFNMRAAMLDNMSWICEEADAIVLLEGWHNSVGASAEATMGLCMDLPMFVLVRGVLKTIEPELVWVMPDEPFEGHDTVNHVPGQTALV